MSSWSDEETSENSLHYKDIESLDSLRHSLRHSHLNCYEDAQLLSEYGNEHAISGQEEDGLIDSTELYEDKPELETDEYYNYWNAPRHTDRQLLPGTLREWLSSLKDPERTVCSVLAFFLFTLIMLLQVVSYVVSFMDLHFTMPYCGEMKGEIEFECHLALFAGSWIASFVLTGVVMVIRYLVWCLRRRVERKWKTI